MKNWKSIKIEEELMKEIEPLLEDTIYTSKNSFATEAIKEKLETIKKEKAAYNLQLLTDEFTDKQVQYRQIGINNIGDLARTVIQNTEDIKKLKQKAKDFDDLSMLMGGKFKTLPIIVEKTKTGKTWRLATKEEIKRSRKIKRSQKST